MSIRNKIMAAIAMAVIVSVAGVGVMVSTQMNKAFINNFRVSGKAQLDRMNSFTGFFFASAISNAELLASSPKVLESLPTLTSYVDATEGPVIVGSKLPEPERLLFEDMDRMHRTIPGYTLIYACNTSGGITLAPDVTLGPRFDPRTRPWYTETLRQRKPIVTEAYVSASDGAAVCTIAAPIRSGNNLAGVVGIDIRLDTLTREVGSVSIGKTGYVLMLDHKNRVIAAPQAAGVPAEKQWLGKTVDELPGDAAGAMKQLLAQKQGYLQTSFDGKDWLASVETTERGWSLIMLQEQDEVFADAMNVTLAILLAGAVIIAFMLAVAWWLARSMTRPLALLATASQGVADGDLQAIPQDEAPFRGELGLLHRSLKRMVSKLGELIETANAKVLEAEEALTLSRNSLQEAEEAKKLAEQARRDGVLQTAGQLGSVIDELASATTRLTSQADQAGRSAGEQHERISGTSVAITEMSNAVGDVAATSARTASLADEARAEAKGGRDLVLQVVSSMGKIEQQSLAMSESLSNLGVQAKDIGQIMNVINDIADQTNLLALNAAIEAARAGDAGRGFAVVADEVRKLAEKTMEATKQVGSAISAIQTGTTGNMEAMREAAAYVSASTETANKAGEALSGIETLVDNTAAEVRSIATACEEQSATLEEITRSAEGINHIAADMADGAEAFTREAEELSSLSARLTAIVTTLKQGG